KILKKIKHIPYIQYSRNKVESSLCSTRGFGSASIYLHGLQVSSKLFLLVGRILLWLKLDCFHSGVHLLHNRDRFRLEIFDQIRVYETSNDDQERLQTELNESNIWKQVE
ncbi:hypothetical protein BLOT_000731, partial [Blomia tropicalis]